MRNQVWSETAEVTVLAVEVRLIAKSVLAE